MKLFGRYLKDRRISLGLSITQMSQRLGHDSSRRISRWERGLEFPLKEDYKKIISAYEISADEWVSVIEAEGKMI